MGSCVKGHHLTSRGSENVDSYEKNLLNFKRGLEFLNIERRGNGQANPPVGQILPQLRV